MTRIKFCGFTKPEDVDAALDFGVDAIGVVRDRSSKRFVDGEGVREISKLTGPYIETVSVYGMVTNFEPEGTNLVQAWDYSLWTLESWFPRVLAVRVPTNAATAEEVSKLAAHQEQNPGEWSGLLLDAHVDGQAGGTGQTVPWEVAAAFVQQSKLPVILAGGLTPDNVAEAIRTVRPYAVDVSSGIESSPGVKDHGKMRAFVEAVRSLET